MSDTWYRDPFELPPYVDDLGGVWAFTGERLSPAPPEPQWPEDWPEELRYLLFQAEVMGTFVEEWHKALRD